MTATLKSASPKSLTPTEYQVTGRQGADYYRVFDDVPAADREIWDRAKGFIDQAAPLMAQAWDDSHYPLDLVHRLGELDLLTDGVVHPLLSEVSPLAAGLINMEISRGDGSLGTVIAVQAGLALRTLGLLGSPEQQEQWLAPLARAEVLGAFALTEPDHGSDSVALETSARRDQDGWILRGSKKWIGNGASGGITFVWARVDDPSADDHGKVRCFLVPQDTPGYRSEVIARKASLRAIHQASITLDDVHLPADAVLPRARSFKDAATVLLATRAGVAWSALGHATACYEASLAYAKQRQQFGRPLAGFQLIQERLTQMLAELTSMQLHCRRIADLDTAGTLAPTQASLAKYHNTRAARRVAATARDLLGGNGILLDYGVAQHMADIESIHTYEGTESIQALLIGRDLTGFSAFT
jgi:glutaryl-CoA dehydrogenase